MDVPCAIMIAVFCLPQASLKLEVKDDDSGSMALISFAGVRASIVLPTDEEAPPRGELGQQLCVEQSLCIPYAARVRDDVSSVELLVAGADGREHFIQFKGPLEQIAALSGRILLAYEHQGRRSLVPLSDFTVARAPAEPSEGVQEAPPGDAQEGMPDGPRDALTGDRTVVLPDEPPEETPWPRP